jgi:predicted permease
MLIFNRLRRRWRALVHRDALEHEIDDEMLYHLEQEIAAHIASGIEPSEARRRALASFGGVQRHKETARDLSGVRWLEELARDARYTVLTLKRRPAFAATTVLTLAIGISATTLVFSVVNALFLRQLPVHEPDRLFIIREQWKNGVPASDAAQPTYPFNHYLDWAESTPDVFSDVVATSITISAVRLNGYATDVTGYVVSSNYFPALGVRPIAGRFFSPASERAANAPPEVVISDELWDRQFNRDPSILGQTLFADSRALTIIGIAPREFRGTMQGIIADLWIPVGVMRHQPASASDTAGAALSDEFVTVFGRLRPGVSRTRAEAALTAIGQRLPAEGQMGGQSQIRAVRLDALSGLPAAARGTFAIFMSMLMATAALVLLIAIANVAGMLLARGAYRRREIAMRLALGASRARLIRQLLTETVILCGLGSVGGVLLAQWVFTRIPATVPAVPIHVAFDVRLDPLVLIVTTVVAFASGIFAGLTPALHATRVDVLSGLRGSPQGQAGDVSRARDVFVVAQLALSLVLLVTAGLFTRALDRGLHVAPGFDPRGVVVARVDLGAHGYDKERGRAFLEQFLTRLRARPEIADASLGWWTPLSRGANGDAVYLPGEQPPNGRRMFLMYGLVDGDYIRMMRVQMAMGRPLRSTDDASAPPVVVINEAAAHKLSPGESPIGRRIKMGAVEREIVGVARDGKYHSLDEGPREYAFVPYTQRYQSQHYNIYARARGDSSVVALAMRQELAVLNPNVALEAAAPLSQQLALFLYPQQIAAVVIGVFGTVGLLLAIVGVYGIVAYHVGQRTREFGIRLALGATPVGLTTLVLRRGAKLIALGVVVGAGLALLLGTAARSFLYGLDAHDPVTFGGVSVLLAAVAMAATFVPARRAASVDPLNSLREE